MKLITLNYPDPSDADITNVHLEIWTDLTGSNLWTKQAERNDTGGWYPGVPDSDCPGDEYCGGEQDERLIWGGPVTEVRWDSGYTNVHFKNLSVREIVAQQTVPPPPPTPPPGPPPPPAPPAVDAFGTRMIYASKAGGGTYGATSWSNGISRTLVADPSDASICVADPHDTTTKFRLKGHDNPVVTIDGNGIMKADDLPGTSGSPRVVILGTWQNVEETVYIRANIPAPDTNPLSLDLRPKTDHYCSLDENAFGGYTHRLDFALDISHFRKEQSHNIGYADPRGQIAFTLNSSVWYGMKAICYNMPDGTLKQETWMDTTDGLNGGTWIKISENVDTGSWQGPVVERACAESTIRSNLSTDGSYIEYKKWTVREIQPAQ